jgi:mercuric ion transport protein
MKEAGRNWFLGSAFAAAVVSSLCCILPVLAIALGIGAFGFASVFETLRPYLLVVAFMALGFAFYKTYFRRETCAEDEVCATKPIGRINQLFLWVATIGIIAFALFPFYTGYLVSAFGSDASEISNQSSAASENIGQSETAIIEVEGMTCEGCASHIDETLKKLKGVISAKASYKDKNVKVVYNPNQITLEKIKKAINEIGYVAK